MSPSTRAAESLLRLYKKQLKKLKQAKRLEDAVHKLWRDAVADTVRSEGTWTLVQYMDYHLSLYYYLEVHKHARSNGREADPSPPCRVLPS